MGLQQYIIREECCLIERSPDGQSALVIALHKVTIGGIVRGEECCPAPLVCARRYVAEMPPLLAEGAGAGCKRLLACW